MDTLPYLFSSLSLVVSVIGLLVSIAALRKSFHDSSATEKENDFRARQQYNAEVRSWANECTTALSDAVYMACRDRADQQTRDRTIAALSALLEQGRLFFPNNPLASPGGETRAPAHPGHRPRILDWLVYSLRICAMSTPAEDEEAEDILKRLQAGFTGDVQYVLDPRDPLSKMSSLPRLLLHGEFMDSSQSHPDIVRAKELLAQRNAQNRSDE